MIASVMYIYAEDGDAMYPPDFQTVIDNNYLTETAFVCPSFGNVRGDLNACYGYIAGQSVHDDPATGNVLLFEKPGGHDDLGGNVAFVDHVEFVRPYSRVEELVKETRERVAKKN